MTGPYPSSIGMMTNLVLLDLSYNHFTGTIPSSFGNIIGLNYMWLLVNSLSGPVPSSLGLLSNLFALAISANQLTGTLPISLGNMSSLTYLGTHSNSLEGTIPDSIFQLKSLQFFRLYSNKLTGTISAEIGKLTALLELYLNNNNFHGTIPTAIGVLSRLKYELFLNDNLLSGTISTVFGSFASLTSMALGDNKLTGTLPTELGALTALQMMMLHDNMLSGFPGQAFSITGQSALKLVDISNNDFSGSVPVEIIQLPGIASVIMISNCFSGRLSSDICSSQTVQTLVLNGLTAGLHCQKPLLFHSYTTARFIEGSLPSCVLGMSSLQVLQLSGNGLSGFLPSTPMHSNLVSLSLSHNRLSGAIPLTIQNHPFQSLDLSFNKLRGVIAADQTGFYTSSPNTSSRVTSQQLTLQINRLSGYLPNVFEYAEGLIVVSGNLFGCSSSCHNALPPADPGSRISQCGSGDLNSALYAWLSVFLVSAGSVLSVIVGSSGRDVKTLPAVIRDLVRHFEKINAWIYMSDHLETMDMFQNMRSHAMVIEPFMNSLKQLPRVALCVTVVVVTVFLPLQLIMKTVDNKTYSTHTYQFAYAPSLTYLTGNAPAAVTVLFAMLLTILVQQTMPHVGRTNRLQASATIKELLSPTENRTSESENQSIGHGDLLFEGQPTEIKSKKSFLRDLMLYFIFPVLNALVMVTANGGYLYVVYFQPNNRAVMAQVSLVAFKLTWNMSALPYFLDWMRSVFSEDKEQVYAQSQSEGILLGVIMLINNILIPIVVTALSDANCFYNALVAPKDITYEYQYFESCGYVFPNGTCTDSIVITADRSYTPPFIYNFQCTSSIMTFYVPVFVIMYIYFAFVSPALKIFAHSTLIRNLTAKLSKIWSMIFSTSDRHGNEMSQPDRLTETGHSQSRASSAGDDDNNNEDEHDHEMLDIDHHHKDSISHVNRASAMSVSSNVSSISLFRMSGIIGSDSGRGSSAASAGQFKFRGAHNISAAMICHIAILVTYGAAYPILAMLICFAITVECLAWRAVLGRLLKQSLKLTDSQQRALVKVISTCCAGTAETLSVSRWLLVGTVLLFYAFFTLDMAGDTAHGNAASIAWAPAVLLAWAFVLGFASKMMHRVLWRRGEQPAITEPAMRTSTTGISMTEIHKPAMNPLQSANITQL